MFFLGDALNKKLKLPSATEALPVAEIDGTTVLTETWARTEAGEGLCVGTPLKGVEVRIVEISDAPIATIAEARELPAGDLDTMKRRSRNYARRQLTWMRKLPAVTWVDVGDRPPGAVAAEIASAL